MRENVVSNLCVPSCARIKKVISCPKYGEVAATINWNGNEITFFRTDFVEFERVPWYFANKLSENDFHEDVPVEVVDSIQKNGGFFLSKNFLTFSELEPAIATGEGKLIEGVDYEAAKVLARSLYVQELESDLMYGVIYDVLGKWLIETETLTEEEWVNSPTTSFEQQILLTRDLGGWNLKEIIGDIFQTEWTQEKWNVDHVAIRDGVPVSDGEGIYPSRTRYTCSVNMRHPNAKIRAFMYWK